MEYEFKVGQYVKYIGNSYEDSYELLENGNMYEIIDICHADSTVKLWLNEGCDDDDYIDWWVSMADVLPKEVDVKVDTSHPNWKVIKKIKQMNVRRKLYGYAF